MCVGACARVLVREIMLWKFYKLPFSSAASSETRSRKKHLAVYLGFLAVHFKHRYIVVAVYFVAGRVSPFTCTRAITASKPAQVTVKKLDSSKNSADPLTFALVTLERL